MEIELQLTKEELNYLYTTLKNHIPQPLEEEVKMYQSTFSKVEHEMIANEIYDLLNKLDDIDVEMENEVSLHDEWEDKLWVEEPDGDGIMIARNRKLWTWETVAKMQALVEKLEAEVNK
jgi:thymidylate synthase